MFMLSYGIPVGDVEIIIANPISSKIKQSHLARRKGKKEKKEGKKQCEPSLNKLFCIENIATP